MNSVGIIGGQAFSLINFRGHLIKDLVAANYKVYALAPDFDDNLREEVTKLGASPVDYFLSRTGMNPLRDLLHFLYLIILLKKLKLDIVLSYFAKPVIFGTLAAWVVGVPKRLALIEGLGFVFTVSNERLTLFRRFLRSVLIILYRIAFDRAKDVIVLNRDDFDDLVVNKCVVKSKVTNIGGIGVDLNEWECVPPVCSPVCFILAARLLREKGIVEFVKSARLIKTIYPDVRFILLGGVDSNPGSLRSEEVSAWVEEGLLEWPGHVSVKPWLAKASVFVLPSYYREGVPRSIQEAMAMGRAVITTDSPGCRETVLDGVNGFLVPIRNVDFLVNKMIQFIERPELIVSMGKASRDLAVQRYDVRTINRKILKLMSRP